MIRFFSFLMIALSLFFLIGCGNWFGDDVVGPEDGTKKIPATGSGGFGDDNNKNQGDNGECDTCDSTYTIPEQPIYDEPDGNQNQNPGSDTNQPTVKDKPVVPDKDLPKDVRNIQLFSEPVTITGKKAEFRLGAFGGMGLQRIIIGVKKDPQTDKFIIGDGIETDPWGAFKLMSVRPGEGGSVISSRQDGGMIYLEVTVNPVLGKMWTICWIKIEVLETKCFEGGVDPGRFLMVSWPSVDNIQFISSTVNIVPNKIENGWIRVKE